VSGKKILTIFKVWNHASASKLVILFYRKRRKADKEGFIPIYCRITIDGLEDEISTGVKVLDHQWDTDAKQVPSTNPFHKAYNNKLGQMKTGLERHFDFVVAKKGIATPALVFESYKTPLNGNQLKI
jgi:Arm DNA-binding domain